MLADRVKGGVHRPLLDGDPEGTLRRMYEQREALYREVADVIVTVDGRSVTDVVDAVLR
jgi:shikimate kinase